MGLLLLQTGKAVLTKSDCTAITCMHQYALSVISGKLFLVLYWIFLCSPEYLPFMWTGTSQAHGRGHQGKLFAYDSCMTFVNNILRVVLVTGLHLVNCFCAKVSCKHRRDYIKLDKDWVNSFCHLPCTALC